MKPFCPENSVALLYIGVLFATACIIAHIDDLSAFHNMFAHCALCMDFFQLRFRWWLKVWRCKNPSCSFPEVGTILRLLMFCLFPRNGTILRFLFFLLVSRPYSKKGCFLFVQGHVSTNWWRAQSAMRSGSTERKLCCDRWNAAARVVFRWSKVIRH